MSVLETFYYLFSADTKPVQEGVKEAQGPIQQLLNSLKATDDQAKETEGSLLSLAKNGIAGLLAAFSIEKLREGVLEMAELTEATGKTADKLGVAVEELSAFDGALRKIGADGDTAKSTLEELGKSLTDARDNGGDALEAFKKLGLRMADIKAGAKDPTKALGELAEGIHKLSEEDAADLGKKVGLDEKTIELMREGRAGFDAAIARQKFLGVVTKEQVEVSKAFNEQLKRTKGSWNDIVRIFEDARRSILTGIMPTATAFMKRLEKLVTFLADHKNFVIGFFTAIAAAVTAYYLPAIIRAGIATWALIAPYLAIGAAVAAVAAMIALVYDDVMAFLDGQDSVIGKIVERWPIVGDIVRSLAEVLRYFFDMVKAGFTFIAEVIESGPTVALENLKTRITGIVAQLSNAFPTLGAVVKTVGNIIGTVASFAFDRWKEVFDLIARVVGFAIEAAGKVAGLIGKAIDYVRGESPADKQPNGRNWLETRNAEVGDMVSMGRGQMRALSTSPVAANSSAAIAGNKTSNKTTTVQVGKVDVHTQATDSAAIASGIGSALTDQLRGAIDTFDDGVVA